MRVATIVGFGTRAEEAKERVSPIYIGDGWLLRFEIHSPDHFFQAELPNLATLLLDDIRQIYRLVLYGHPGSGLQDVRIYLSAEDEYPLDENKLEELQSPVPRQEPAEFPRDEMHRLFADFLRSAKADTKGKIAAALERERRNATSEEYCE